MIPIPLSIGAGVRRDSIRSSAISTRLHSCDRLELLKGMSPVLPYLKSAVSSVKRSAKVVIKDGYVQSSSSKGHGLSVGQQSSVILKSNGDVPSSVLTLNRLSLS